MAYQISFLQRTSAVIALCACSCFLSSCGQIEQIAAPTQTTTSVGNTRSYPAPAPAGIYPAPDQTAEGDIDATKRSLDETAQSLRLTAAALPTLTGTILLPTINPYPTPSPEIGISTDCEIANHYLYESTNCWLGLINDTYVSAVAGVATQGSSQGVLAVFTDSVSLYNTPTLAGSITITGAANGHLTLVGTDGTLFTFDVATVTWEMPIATPTLSER